MSPLDFTNSNMMRGQFLRTQGRYQDAIPYLERALESDPRNGWPYAELAQCWNNLGHYRKKALGAIDQAIALDPHNSYFIGLKAWILVCQYKPRKALEIADQALALHPDHTLALNAKVNAYTRLFKWTEAEAAACRILVINPRDLPALNLLAQVYRITGRHEDCALLIESILKQVPNHAFAHFNLGQLVLAQGDYLLAQYCFLEALKFEPSNKLFRCGLICSLHCRVWLFRIMIQCVIGMMKRARKNPLQVQAREIHWQEYLVVLPLSLLLASLLILGLYSSEGVGPNDLRFIPLLETIRDISFSACIFLIGAPMLANVFLCWDPLGKQVLSPRYKICALLLVSAIFLLALVITFFTPYWEIAPALILYVSWIGWEVTHPRSSRKIHVWADTSTFPDFVFPKAKE